MEIVKFIYQEVSYFIKAGTDISLQKIGQLVNQLKSNH